jgi:carbonic anhydrase
MNLLYSFKKGVETNMKTLERSPLKAWLHRHGSVSLSLFEKLEKNGFQEPLVFPMEGPFKQFVAYIDPDNKFTYTDKLSQASLLKF